MIPLFLVPLFIVVVYAVYVSKPFRSSFSDGTTFGNEPTTQRPHLSLGESTPVDCRQHPSIGNPVDAIALLLRLEFWTQRNRTIVGLALDWSLRAVKNRLELSPFSQG